MAPASVVPMMVVVYKGANILSLPYTDPTKGEADYVHLTPGNNEVPAEIWDAVKKYPGADKRMKHYRTMLKEVKIPEASNDDDPIDITAMNAEDAIEVVNGMTTIADLEAAFKAEQGKKPKSRITVCDAIEDQMNKVQSTLDKIEEEKNKGKE